ncbi:SDR family NAD(P)-dependent oxidoreductase [Allokutzneria oryzae]|uniref:SDR family NAD(P)-dependent oxidoreductase n=1 Tax=Allokutzneria oryzae TaxID=1378989 RepID=A0ABV5ZVW4_9PSEU
MAHIALITGGSRGLGRNTALHLARQGVDLVLTYRTGATEAEAVVAQARELGRTAVALPLDVGDTRTFAAFTEAVRGALAERWGRDTFDFLVNNAGVGRNAPFGEVTEETFDELMNIHVKGVYFLTQALLPLLTDGGRIINLSTGLTRFAYSGYSAYATMKGAVEVLTRYLAKELGPRGIAVNTVAPGPVETDFGGGVVRDNPEVNSFLATQTALGRTGQPDDIGAAIAALLTEGTGWINAQRIEISGGTFL